MRTLLARSIPIRNRLFNPCCYCVGCSETPRLLLSRSNAPGPNQLASVPDIGIASHRGLLAFFIPPFNYPASGCINCAHQYGFQRNAVVTHERSCFRSSVSGVFCRGGNLSGVLVSSREISRSQTCGIDSLVRVLL